MSPVVAHAVVWLPTAALVAYAMDLWAALLHGRVWHGRLWSIHRSHHEPRRGALELNDWLSLLHAPFAIALILYGCAAEPGVRRELAFGVGVGMTAFGLAYLVVHDGLVHGRLPVPGLSRWRWLRRIASAHRVHHTGRAAGAPYGLFTGPRELERAVRLARAGRPARITAPPARASSSRETDPNGPRGRAPVP